MDAGGNAVEQFYWLPADWTASGERSGWIDGNTGDPVEMTLANGLSVLVESTDDSGNVVTVTVAGEVSTNTATVAAVDGFNFVGNSSPVPIDLQDIRIDVLDDNATGLDNIQILDADGNMGVQYYWLPADWTASGQQTGWVDSNTGDPAEGVTLAPGQGVLLETTAGVTISVPAAIQ